MNPKRLESDVQLSWPSVTTKRRRFAETSSDFKMTKPAWMAA